MFPHKISANSLTFFGGGRMWSVPADHPGFEAIKEQLILSMSGANTLDMDGIIDLYDSRRGMVTQSGGRLSFIGERLCFEGKPLSNQWTDRIEKAKKEGKSFSPIMNALEDLLTKGGQNMIDRLPKFIECQRLGLFPDGRIASFLVVRDDYSDVRSGVPYVYKIKSTFETTDDHQHSALYVGALGYQLGEGQTYHFSLMENRKVMLVAFKPSDALSQHNQKLRVRKLDVIDEMDLATVDAFIAANHDYVEGYGLDAAA